MNELPQLPLARTDAQNVFLEQNTFSQSIRMIRKDRKTFQPLIFANEEDIAKNPNDFVGMALDMSNNGGFWVLAFDGVLQADLFQIGTSRPGCRGHMGICCPPLPGTQLGIVDLANSGVSISLSIYSDHTGLWLNGSAQHADRMVVERGDTPNSAWVCWHQGTGAYDWRMGMMPDSYDLAIFGGSPPTSRPEFPGLPWMTFMHGQGGEKDVIKINTLFQCQEITDLQAKVQALNERITALEATK